jgi:hypothetical protein
MVAPQGAVDIPDEAVRAEVEAVLSSKSFARARSLTSLLTYLCDKVLRGEADQLKEYTVAVEAYGRGEDFQQKNDAIVRVEIKRLRDRLKHYYETEGAGHETQIVIPVGQYIPQFVRRQPEAPPAGEASAPPEIPPYHSPATAAPGWPAESAPLTASPLPASPETSSPDSAAAETTALPPGVRKRRWAAVTLTLLLTVTALLLALRQWKPLSLPVGANTLASAAPNLPAAPPALADTGEVRILAGSRAARFVDQAGKVWVGDCFFTDGKPERSAAPFIYRTADPEIYQRSRQGDFRYDIPLKPGVYELRLHFAENFYGPEGLEDGGEVSRLFLVNLNGRPLLRPLDVYSDAGGSRTAEVKVFKDVSPAADGQLHLEFLSWTHNKALLNGLEILPSKPGMGNPVRLTAQHKVVLSADGREWLPDRYFKGGRSITRTAGVAGVDTPELYQAERFGNFSYAIPVAAGRYTVTLHFAERYFGPNNPSPDGRGPGSRVFHVFHNGKALLTNFDIFKEAGGQDRAVAKRFTGLTPDAQGKLVFEFKPVVNYPLVNAIEVVDENWK